MNTTAAIYERLTGASDLMFRLDEYLGLSAVFDDMAPDDYLARQERPCVIIAAPALADPVETFTESGQSINRDLRIYAKRSSSVAELDALAGDIRDLFHDQPEALSIDGARTIICQASGPTDSPTTDPSLVGRRISLRLELERI